MGLSANTCKMTKCKPSVFNQVKSDKKQTIRKLRSGSVEQDKKINKSAL